MCGLQYNVGWEDLESKGAKKCKAFKVVQIKSKSKMKFWYIYARNLKNIFKEHDLYLIDFWHKIKIYNFDPYNALLAIATNIAMLFMTGFVLQGHMNIYNHFPNNAVSASQNII